MTSLWSRAIRTISRSEAGEEEYFVIWWPGLPIRLNGWENRSTKLMFLASQVRSGVPHEIKFQAVTLLAELGPA